MPTGGSAGIVLSGKRRQTYAPCENVGFPHVLVVYITKRIKSTLIVISHKVLNSFSYVKKELKE